MILEVFSNLYYPVILWFVLKEPKDPCTEVLPGALQDGLKLIRFVIFLFMSGSGFWTTVRKMGGAQPEPHGPRGQHCSSSILKKGLLKDELQHKLRSSSEERWVHHLSPDSLWPVVSSLRELRSSLGMNLFDFQVWPSISGCLSEVFLPFDFPACLDWAQLSPKTVFSLSQLLLPTFLAALKIILFFFFFPHGITTVRAHLERLSRWPWSRSSRHCFQTQSWLFWKHSLAFFTPRGIPFNLAGLKASCWTMTS